MSEPHFWRLRDTEILRVLQRKRNANHLLQIIATRARRPGSRSKAGGLREGEAFVGDYAALDLTRSEYRTALKVLRNMGLICTRSGHMGTERGTIATLLTRDVYDISYERSDHRLTTHQPDDDQTPTQDQPRHDPTTAINREEEGEGDKESEVGKAAGRRRSPRKRSPSGDPLTWYRDTVAAMTEPLPGAFEPLYGEWIQHRVEISKALTAGAVRNDVRHFAEMVKSGGAERAEAKAREWIELAIQNRWQGWYFQDKFEKWKAEIQGGAASVEPPRFPGPVDEYQDLQRRVAAAQSKKAQERGEAERRAKQEQQEKEERERRK